MMGYVVGNTKTKVPVYCQGRSEGAAGSILSDAGTARLAHIDKGRIKGVRLGGGPAAQRTFSNVRELFMPPESQVR